LPTFFPEWEVVEIDIHFLGCGDQAVVFDLSQPVFPLSNLGRCLVNYPPAL